MMALLPWKDSHTPALFSQAIFQELGVKDVLPQCGGYATVTLETDKQVC